MTGHFPGIPEHALDVFEALARDAGLIPPKSHTMLQALILGRLQRLERPLIRSKGPLVQELLLLFECRDLSE